VTGNSHLLEQVRIAIATSRKLRRTAEDFIAESDALLRALRELKVPHLSLLDSRDTLATSPEAEVESPPEHE
jgi:hypothetical protein